MAGPLFPSILPGRDDDEDSPNLEGCRFCEDYVGENWRNHAAQVHPDAYREYKEQDEE